MSKQSWLRELFGDHSYRQYSIHVVDVVGSINAAIFLEHIMYHQKEKKQKWVYRKQEWITEKTRLTRYNQATARKQLCELGILEEKQGLHGIVWFTINDEHFHELMEGHAISLQGGLAESFAGFSQSDDHPAGFQQSTPLDSSKVPRGFPTSLLINTDAMNTDAMNTERGAVAPSSPRGSRIPKGWFPNDAGMLFAAEQGLSNDAIQLEIDKFWDHWTAQPGQKGVKLDWNATWRNWVRRSKTFSRSGGSSSSAEKDERRERLTRLLGGNS